MSAKALSVVDTTVDMHTTPCGRDAVSALGRRRTRWQLDGGDVLLEEQRPPTTPECDQLVQTHSVWDEPWWSQLQRGVEGDCQVHLHFWTREVTEAAGDGGHFTGCDVTFKLIRGSQTATLHGATSANLELMRRRPQVGDHPAAKVATGIIERVWCSAKVMTILLHEFLCHAIEEGVLGGGTHFDDPLSVRTVTEPGTVDDLMDRPDELPLLQRGLPVTQFAKNPLGRGVVVPGYMRRAHHSAQLSARLPMLRATIASDEIDISASPVGLAVHEASSGQLVGDRAYVTVTRATHGLGASPERLAGFVMAVDLADFARTLFDRKSGSPAPEGVCVKSAHPLRSFVESPAGLLLRSQVVA